MNRQEEIEIYLKEPLRVSNKIIYTGDGNGSKSPSNSATGIVTKIEGDTVYFTGCGNELSRNINDIDKDISHIGVNPFKDRKRYENHKIDIQQLLSRLGYDKHGKEIVEDYFDGSVKTCTMDPVIEFDDKEFHYQRGYVWDILDKVRLISSIYNGKNIGTFTFRQISYEAVQDKFDNNKEDLYFAELVDGKQRASAIIEFVQSNITDEFGNYYHDLSDMAKRRFMGCLNLSYCQMPENTTDSEVLDYFLTMNETGKPVSRTHLNGVKQIQKIIDGK
jgi:hypothetical protein